VAAEAVSTHEILRAAGDRLLAALDVVVEEEQRLAHGAEEVYHQAVRAVQRAERELEEILS
jgi:hypothetical protein